MSSVNSSDRLLETLQDVLDYIINSSDKKYHFTRLVKDLRSKQKKMASEINTFIVDLNHNNKNKTDILMKALRIVTDIINYIPYQEEVLRLGFTSYANFIRFNLADISFDSDEIVSFSSASILSEILLGDIKKYDKLPYLPSVNDHKEFFDKFSPLSNVIETNFALYSSLISNLKIIHQEDFENWSKEAIHNFYLYWELMRKFNILQLIRSNSMKDYKILYFNVFAMAATLGNMINTFIEIYKKSRNQWPGGVLIEGEMILDAIEIINDGLISEIDRMHGELKSAKISGLLGNDQPHEEEYYYDYKLVQLDLQIIKRKLKLFRNISEMCSIKSLEQIDSIIIKTNKMLEFIIDMTGGIENILQSYYVGAFFEVLSDIIPYYAIKSVIVNDKSVLFSLFDKYKIILEEFKDNSKIFLIKILGELFVLSRLNIDINFDIYYNALTNNEKNFIHKPREYISLVNLRYITSFFIDTVTNETRSNMIENILSHGIIEEDTYFQTDINILIKYFNNSITLKEEHYKMNHRYELIAFDPYSYLIPDFKYYFDIINKRNIQYYPFNRCIDRIIP